MLTSGVAFADRDRGWRGHRDSSRHSGGTVVRDHRYREPVRVDRRDYRDYRRGDRHNYRRYDRRPVYVNNGRFVFHGGVSRHYTRPVIRQRYYDYRYRPQVIIQNYDPVPGYIWIQGNWNWNGYEWIWVPGRYEIDQTYNYNNDYYNDGYTEGGVYFNGSVRF